MSPRLRWLEFVFWQDAGPGSGDAGPGSGGGPGPGPSDGSGGGTPGGDPSQGGGEAQGGQGQGTDATGGVVGSVSAADQGTPSFGQGDVTGFHVAGVNAPGPMGIGPTSAAPGGGQAAPGIGPQGGVSTAAATGGGGAVGGRGGGPSLGPADMSVAAINSILHGIGVQGQNPAIQNLLREAGLLGVPPGVLTGVPTATTPITTSPIAPPSLTTDEITALNKALTALHSGGSGSGGIGSDAVRGGTAGETAPDATSVAVAPRAAPAPAAAPTPLGLGSPAGFGTVAGGPTPGSPGPSLGSPAQSPIGDNVSPTLANLAQAFMGGGFGGNKVQNLGVGGPTPGGNFGPSPWMTGGTAGG